MPERIRSRPRQDVVPTSQRPTTIAMIPPEGSVGSTVRFVSPILHPRMPWSYRKLDRALSRLEDVVARWERSLAPPTTYHWPSEISFTAIQEESHD